MKPDIVQEIIAAAKRYVAAATPKDVDKTTRVHIEAAFSAGAFSQLLNESTCEQVRPEDKTDETGDTLITIDEGYDFYYFYKRLSDKQKTYVRHHIIRDADTSEISAELSRRGLNVEEA